MVNLGLLKTQFCQKRLDKSLLTEMSLLEKTLRNLLRNIDTSTDFKKSTREFVQTYETLKALIMKNCYLKRKNIRWVDLHIVVIQKKSFKNQEADVVKITTRGHDKPVDLPEGQLLNDHGEIALKEKDRYVVTREYDPDHLHEPPQSGLRIVRLLKSANRKVLENVIKPMIDGLWKVIKLLKATSRNVRRNAPQFLIENWMVVIVVTVACVHNKEEWILDLFPADLKKILRVTMRFLFEIAGIMMEKSIKMKSMKKSFLLSRDAGIETAEVVRTALRETTEKVDTTLTGFEGRMKIMMLEAALLIGLMIILSGIVPLLLDSKKRERLPKLPKLFFTKEDGSVGVKYKTPMILLLIFGATLAGIKFSYSESGSNYIKQFQEWVMNEPEVQTTVVQVQALTRATSIALGPAAVEDNDTEVYDIWELLYA